MLRTLSGRALVTSNCAFVQSSSINASTPTCCHVAVRYRRRMTGAPLWAVPKYAAVHPSVLSPVNTKWVREEYASPLILRPSGSELIGAADEDKQVWTPTSKRTGLLVRKIGVLPQWLDNGDRIICTMLQVLDNHVISYLSPVEWYEQSKVGKRKAFNERGMFGKMTVGAIDADPTKLTKPYLGLFTRAGIMPKQKLASFMVTHDARLTPGTPLVAAHFRVGEYVDVTGKTIDWGFEGGMHRWGMRGQPGDQRGTTKAHRRVGSIGSKGDRKVQVGKKLPGHMGWEWRSHRGVRIVRINHRHQVIYVHSNGVPGEVNQVLLMSDSWCTGKHIQNPPFPTHFAQQNESLEEQFYEKLYQFTNPSIEFDAAGDDAFLAALRRSQVKKQAKAKRK